MKITIFGLAGSGTSTVWKILAEKLDSKFMSSWNIMRSWAEDLWLSLYEFEDKVVKTDKSFDLKLDQRVKDFWKQNESFIFESRLARSFIPDSYKIYLYCEESERYNRIHKREWWELQDITIKNQKRESELVFRYKEVYPDIVFPPKEQDFDLFVDSTNMSIEEVLEKILSEFS